MSASTLHQNGESSKTLLSSSASTELPPNHPISQRVRSVLIQPVHDELATKKALDTLASLYAADKTVGSVKPVDTERARNNVQRDSRNRMHRATNDFIAVLKTVDDSLMRLSDDMTGMYASCNLVEEKLRKAGESSKYLIEHSEGLQEQRDSTKAQRELSSLFLQRFTLSEEEREAIHSREVRVGSRLFSALDRLERIRTDCRILLQGSDSNDTKAGMDIMSSTAQDLESAYQKIFKWCSFEFRQPVKEGLEVSRHLREAVTRLMKERQNLLRSALSMLVTTRSSILMNAFVNALTVGGPAPTFLPRPIELHAHDPIRYVGDMLAWIHQTLASEREFLTALFGEKEGEGGRRIGQRRRGLEGSLDLTGSDLDGALLGPGEALVREVLDRNLEGCCRPLKIRVQQTVRSQEGSVTTYRLAHLVQFYRSTMEKTIGTRAALSRTLGEIAQLSLEAFFFTLDRQAAGLARFEEAPEPDLAAPPPLLGASSTLKELLSEYQLSLTDEITAHPPKQGDKQGLSLHDFDLILVRIVDPMLELCRRMATIGIARRARNKSEETATWESSIFLCNCFGYVINVLQPYSFTASKVSQVRQEMAKVAEGLTEKHYHQLLEESGLAPLITAIHSQPSDTPLSHHTNAEPAKVTQYLSAFNDFLASAEVATSWRLARVQSPPLRGSIHSDALRRLVGTYGEVEENVRLPSNKYEWRETLIRRSREEVELLLGL